MKRKSYDIYLGIFVLVGLVILGYMIIRFGGLTSPKQQYNLTIKFNYVGGLVQGAPVYYAGVECGKVKRILPRGYRDNKVRVIVAIDNDTVIRKNDVPEIITFSLLGEKYINFRPGEPYKPIVPRGSVLEGEDPKDLPTEFAKVIEVIASKETQEEIRQVIKNIRALTDEETQESFKKAINNIYTASEILIKDLADVRTFFSKQTTDDLKKIVQNIKEGSKDLPVLAREASSFLLKNKKKFSDLVSNLQQNSENLNSVFAIMNDIATEIKTGQGNLGKLIYRSDLYDNLNSLITTARKGGVFWGRVTRKEEKEKEQLEAQKNLIWRR